MRAGFQPLLLGLGRPPEVRYQLTEGVTPRLQRVLDSLELSAERNVQALVDELSRLSPEFAAMWRDNDVRTYGRAQISPLKSKKRDVCLAVSF